MKLETIGKIQHPGFILFEGLDLTGKSCLAKKVALKIQEHLKVNADYNHNKGFLQKGLVESSVIKSLSATEKLDYLLAKYLEDKLPSDPKNFKEIIQDRHAPTILFQLLLEGKSIQELSVFINQYTKPKHIFLVECDYNEKLKRAEAKRDLSELEKRILFSKEKNDNAVNAYQQIVESYAVPYTIIDTTHLSKDDAADSVMQDIKRLGLLAYDLPIDNLFADYEKSVFKSTAEKKLKWLENGAIFEPILVIRKIDPSGFYADTLKDGRHRAYAIWKMGLKAIKAYVNYEPIEKISPSNLSHISEFTFRANDLYL